MPDFGAIFSFDKFAHLGVFSVLCFLMIIGFTKQNQFLRIRKKPVKYSLIISGSYAAILELGQTFIPERYTNWWDMAFNLAGVLVGYLLFILIYKFSFV